jgi:peptidoglycan/xylan/chitin deacetylase (PgdA/CDA1 family)
MPPGRKTAYLTLDMEPDHCDLVEGCGYESFAGIDRLIRMTGEMGVPLTVFVAGRVLDERPDAVRLFVDAGAEIELHGYSHKCNEDGIQAIERGLDAYRRVLDRSPLGYRAPLGMISDAEIARLAREGFLFDSSLFPSIFPGRFCNIRAPSTPFVHPGTQILEIPISVVPVARFPVSLSYVQLSSYPAFRALAFLFGLTDSIVVDFHLHDVFPSSVFRDLPLKWKLIYSRFFLRNRMRGIEDFRRLLSFFEAAGYGFARLTDLHAEYA